jgi:hypothetical protein
MPELRHCSYCRSSWLCGGKKPRECPFGAIARTHNPIGMPGAHRACVDVTQKDVAVSPRARMRPTVNPPRPEKSGPVPLRERNRQGVRHCHWCGSSANIRSGMAATATIATITKVAVTTKVVSGSHSDCCRYFSKLGGFRAAFFPSRYHSHLL